MSQQVKIWRLLDLMQSAGIKGLTITEKTANYTVVSPDDSGKIWIANAANAVTFTVPIGLKGNFYIFLSLGAGGLKVAGAVGDKMVVINDAAADSVSLETANQIVGGGFLVFSDGTQLYAIHLNPSGSQTVTLAT